jgi:hypothetical protein
MSQPTKDRLILAIIDLAGDELTKAEQTALWTESNSKLVDRLIHIALWYAEAYHESV